jgi:APA family basic amino acid/polyamine antiporter
MRAWAWSGATAAVVVVGLGVQADWKPYAALAGWAAIGLVYYFFAQASNGAERAAESRF